MVCPSLVTIQLTSFPQPSVRRSTVKSTPSHSVGDVVKVESMPRTVLEERQNATRIIALVLKIMIGVSYGFDVKKWFEFSSVCCLSKQIVLLLLLLFAVVILWAHHYRISIQPHRWNFNLSISIHHLSKSTIRRLDCSLAEELSPSRYLSLDWGGGVMLIFSRLTNCLPCYELSYYIVYTTYWSDGC